MKIETLLKELYYINQLPLDNDAITQICLFHMKRMGFGLKNYGEFYDNPSNDSMQSEFEDMLDSTLNFSYKGFEKKIAPFIKNI